MIQNCWVQLRNNSRRVTTARRTGIRHHRLLAIPFWRLPAVRAGIGPTRPPTYSQGNGCCADTMSANIEDSVNARPPAESIPSAKQNLATGTFKLLTKTAV